MSVSSRTYYYTWVHSAHCVSRPLCSRAGEVLVLVLAFLCRQILHSNDSNDYPSPIGCGKGGDKDRKRKGLLNRLTT